MAGILSKLRTLTLGNLHELLDAAIDLNSVAACKQHVRDLEEAKGKIMDEAAVAKGRVGQAEGDLKAIQLKIDTNTEHAQLLLDDDDPSNDGDAQTLMERVVADQELLETKQADLATAKQTADALAEAARKIAAKHAEMVANVRRLESLERSTKAKEQATSAIKKAAGAANAAGEVSVDDVAQRLKDRSVAADAKFQNALGTMGDSVSESVQAAKAKQLIAKMRAGKKAGGGTPPSSPTGC